MQAMRRPIVFVCLLLLSSIAILVGWTMWSGAHRNRLTELAAAVGSDYEFDARLTGGFLPRGEAATRRSATSAAGDRLSPDVRIAIARLEKRAAVDQTPRALAALGVAYLVGGNVDRSIATLEDVTSLAEDAA